VDDVARDCVGRLHRRAVAARARLGRSPAAKLATAGTYLIDTLLLEAIDREIGPARHATVKQKEMRK
jgi:hypothetical protein